MPEVNLNQRSQRTGKKKKIINTKNNYLLSLKGKLLLLFELTHWKYTLACVSNRVLMMQNTNTESAGRIAAADPISSSSSCHVEAKRPPK